MRLRLVPDKTNIKFVNKRKLCLVLSIAVLIGTALSVYYKGFNFGIDFTGGIILEAHTDEPADLGAMRNALGDGVSLQTIGSPNEVLIRVAPKDDKTVSQDMQAQEVKNKLLELTNAKIEFRKIDYVGAQVGGELIKNAITALILSFVAMFVYMWFRFEWQYGVGALLALFHDAVAVIGFYSITGLEFDLTSIAAILTVIGWSINDSVVIYDRMRENIRKYKKMPLGDLIDLCVNETLGRTVITAGTTILALIALATFGGDVLRGFSVGMLFGVIVGTYSSIYVSAIFLIYMDPRRSEDPSTGDKAEVLTGKV